MKTSQKRVAGLLLACIALVAWFWRSGEGWKLYYRVKHAPQVLQASKDQGLDPHLVAALVFTESRFRRGARSEVGAIGLMQLMPSTAKDMMSREAASQFQESELYDVELNLRLGSRYLAKLIREFEGDEVLALAAYNAGPNQVKDWLEQDKAIQFPETQMYVHEVRTHRDRLRQLYPEWSEQVRRVSVGKRQP